MNTDEAVRTGGSKVSRRQALRWGAGASISAGLVLAGCSTTKVAAKPTTNEPHIHLVVAPWSGAPGGTGTVGQKLLLEGLQVWSGQYRNVDVHIVPGEANPSTTVNSILTGTAPDVFEMWILAPFFDSNLVLPLTDYMKQDGVSTDLWTPSLIPVLTYNGELMGLPAYTNIFAMTVNLSFFDNQGLPRPNPDWTYEDLQALAPHLMTTVNGTKQPGLSIGTYSNTIGNRTWIYQAFGGGIVDSSGTKSTMSTPNSLAAGTWLYNDLVLPGYAVESAGNLPNIAVLMYGTAAVLPQVTQYSGFLWDYYPMPAFPVQGATSPKSTWRTATYQTDDSYLVSAATRHPKHAWDLVRWMCADTYWQKYMFKVFLLAPSLNSLWPEWITTLQSRVQPLQGKNLQVFADATTKGYGFPQQYYKYEDAQCELLVAPFIQDIHTQADTVTEAFLQIDKVVDAFEATAAATAGVTTSVSKEVNSVQPGPTTNYPTPSATGGGSPSTTSPYVSAQNGVYTVLGDGADMAGTSNSDTCVFAAAATTATEATWTCELTSIANISEKQGTQTGMANWIRAGLMARSDLSDNAAMALLSVTGYYGFDFLVRPTPGGPTQEQKFLFWKDSNGSIQELLSPLTSPASNYLIKPVWLRITRKGTAWTPYASLDGTNFTQLGPSIVAPVMAGAWVGVTANAYNGQSNNEGYIRATFQSVTQNSQALALTQNVQIGSTGAPPQAGTVPSNWATGTFS